MGTLVKLVCANTCDRVAFVLGANAPGEECAWGSEELGQ